MDNEQEPKKTFIKINGQMIRVGTLEEFAQEIFGETLDSSKEELSTIPRGLILGVEKYRTHAHRWHSLIWIGKGEAWLAAEDQTRYRRYRDVVMAGRKLAGKTGAYFDERKR